MFPSFSNLFSSLFFSSSLLSLFLSFSLIFYGCWLFSPKSFFIPGKTRNCCCVVKSRKSGRGREKLYGRKKERKRKRRRKKKDCRCQHGWKQGWIVCFQLDSVIQFPMKKINWMFNCCLLDLSWDLSSFFLSSFSLSFFLSSIYDKKNLSKKLFLVQLFNAFPLFFQFSSHLERRRKREKEKRSGNASYGFFVCLVKRKDDDTFCLGSFFHHRRQWSGNEGAKDLSGKIEEKERRRRKRKKGRKERLVNLSEKRFLKKLTIC